jgi:hypothetical protein
MIDSINATKFNFLVRCKMMTNRGIFFETVLNFLMPGLNKSVMARFQNSSFIDTMSGFLYLFHFIQEPLAGKSDTSWGNPMG